MRVAFGQISSEHGRAFDLVGEERVDSEDEERRRREEVSAVEGAIEIALAVLADFLGVFGLFSAVEASRVHRSHQQSLETDGYHHQTIGLYL